MEEDKSIFWKNIMQYGLAIGLALIIFSVLTYFFDVAPKSPIQYLTYLILVGGIIISANNYKKTNNIFLTYGKAFKIGFFVSVIAAFILAVYIFIFNKFIDPDAIDRMLKLSEQELSKHKELTQEQIDVSMQMMKKFSNITVLTIASFLSMVLNGTLLSLITSIFVKSRKR